MNEGIGGDFEHSIAVSCTVANSNWFNNIGFSLMMSQAGDKVITYAN